MLEPSGIDINEAEKGIRVLQRCEDAVSDYRKRRENNKGEKIDLADYRLPLRHIVWEQGIKNLPVDAEIDIYNPSNIFRYRGKEHLAARIEPTGKKFEHSSVVAFFQKEGKSWKPRTDPIFKLQDPRITWINGEMLFSGVELSADDKGEMVIYRQVFYRGKDLDNLVRFFEGPLKMKDICLVNLADKRIGVYTRPTGEKGGRGQIGFTIIDSLDDLTVEKIDEAPLLNDRFPEDEWGGVNEARQMPDGRIFVLGHRAYFDEAEKRHYYPWAFVHDLEAGRLIDLGILAERKDFPWGPAKDFDLEDVLYSGGLMEVEESSRLGRRMLLLVGLSDTEAGMIEIDDPSPLWTPGSSS